MVKRQHLLAIRPAAKVPPVFFHLGVCSSHVKTQLCAVFEFGFLYHVAKEIHFLHTARVNGAKNKYSSCEIAVVLKTLQLKRKIASKVRMVLLGKKFTH